MSYRVIWSQKAEKNLEVVGASDRSRIVAKVESITDAPYSYVKRLKGVPLYSLRVGSYRIIVDIKNAELVVFVVKFGHRSNVYDRL